VSELKIPPHVLHVTGDS